MSLTSAEQRTTSVELRRNLDLSGLTLAQVADDLAVAPARVQAALDVDDADPVDVWLIRDYLEQAVRDSGGEPVEHTVLTEASRRLARRWFPLQGAPHHDFSRS